MSYLNDTLKHLAVFEQRPRRPAFASFIRYFQNLQNEEAFDFYEKALVPSTLESINLPAVIPNGLRCKASIRSGVKVFSAKRDPRLSLTSQCLLAQAILDGRDLTLDDVVLAAVVSGRESAVAGVESIAGPILSVLLVLINVTKSQSCRTVIQQMDGYI